MLSAEIATLQDHIVIFVFLLLIFRYSWSGQEPYTKIMKNLKLQKISIFPAPLSHDITRSYKSYSKLLVVT